MSTRALVLGGGGVAGIAWELGYLLGIEDRSPELAHALIDSDSIVGTSAGATVAAQITSGVALEELFAFQLSTTSAEIDPGVDFEQLASSFAVAFADPDATPIERVRAIGALAIAAKVVDVDVRRAVIAGRLPFREWPVRALRITASNAETGALAVFDKGSGIDLVDAVAASCAVPGVWPTVSIDGTRYMDGGVGSSTNTAVADGCSHVVVLVPSAEPGQFMLGGTVADEVAALTQSSAHTVFADVASISAFGPNPLDPATRPPSALAGRAQGARDADALGHFLGIEI